MSGPLRLRGAWGRRLVTAVPFLWLAVFFLAPFAIVFAISLSRSRFGVPPYEPLLQDGAFAGRLDNYAFLLDDPLYLTALVNSIRIAATCAAIALAIGYPMALAIARAPGRWRTPLLLAIVLPFWTSFLIRVYAWMGLLKNEGLVNAALQGLGLTDQPLQLLQTGFAVHLGIVYSYLPFMVLPLYATLERQDLSLLEAAADLGARPWRAFLTITLPLSLPGVLAGCLLVFIPAVGEFVIPELLGSSRTIMIGKVLWTEFFNNRDWPLASALAVAMLLLIVAPLAWLEHLRVRRAESAR
ncbi:MAG: ABC transporter permease subunit [Alphaproteobacteria bacterium]|nr:ABC transporter permease subunit [Alphaproteobacteria bacterium]